MASVVFAAHGNSFDAYHSGGSSKGMTLPNTLATTSGGIGGTVWDLTSAASKCVTFEAHQNTPNTRQHSILIRCAPNYSGIPASSRAFWSLASGTNSVFTFLEIYHAITTGQLSLGARNELGQGIAATATFGVYTPVAGTYNDIVLTYDGTAGTAAFKCYIDGVLLGSINGQNGGFTAAWTNMFFKIISIGSSFNSSLGTMSVDEVVIWDGLIDPTQNVTLTSGLGLLNGASRTAYVLATAVDGSAYTDPGIANVRSTTSYTYAGVSQTGTCAVPNSGVVLSGNAVDATTGSVVLASTSSVAASIWDALTSGYVTTGTFGKLVQKLLKLTDFLGLK